MTTLTCIKCPNEATSLDVATGLVVCINHVTPGGLRFEIRPLGGGGYGVYKVNGHINMLEEDFFKKIKAWRYGYNRMVEERKHLTK